MLLYMVSIIYILCDNIIQYIYYDLHITIPVKYIMCYYMLFVIIYYNELLIYILISYILCLLYMNNINDM